jgi:dTDP-4-dehydrorhamnose reductase
MRLAVTGRNGQVATALLGCASDQLTVVPIGRPEVDLERPETLAAAIAAAQPDIVVNAAAWTAVDLAETEPDRAAAVNEGGARAVALAAAAAGVPIIHLSTDYVFDGTKSAPYAETDAVAPTGVYGATKLAGEQAVAQATPNHLILRTAWVYAPQGKNFVRTMLRLAGDRDEVSVVSDQIGNPTYAPDIAQGILAAARNLIDRPNDANLRGVFHMSGGGETSWAGLAETVFANSRERGGPFAEVRPIGTADYPTPARRPANSRLDCSKLASIHGIRLPAWHDGLARCLDQIVPSEFKDRHQR